MDSCILEVKLLEFGQSCGRREIVHCRVAKIQPSEICQVANWRHVTYMCSIEAQDSELVQTGQAGQIIDMASREPQPLKTCHIGQW